MTQLWDDAQITEALRDRPHWQRDGDEIVRTSTIENVVAKEGRTGPLVFVTVRHEVRANGGPDPALVEHHDIVYRAGKQPGEVEPPPTPGRTPWAHPTVGSAR